MWEPALLIGQGKVLAANAAGQAVADDPASAVELIQLAGQAARTRTAHRRALAVDLINHDALLEFDVTPWGDSLALALGRDITVATGIREALQFSRERYRSFLEIATDCIWETELDGTLALLAPNAIFGRAAATLIGRPLNLLFAGSSGSTLFARRHKPEWIAIGIQAADGATIHGAAIMAPMQDPDSGAVSGYRGCFRRADRPMLTLSD